MVSADSSIFFYSLDFMVNIFFKQLLFNMDIIPNPKGTLFYTLRLLITYV